MNKETNSLGDRAAATPPSPAPQGLHAKARRLREECEIALRDIRRTLASVQKGLDQESRRLR